MIDLHTHTKYSDGTDDVITLLKKAEEIGLECLSITDHGTCKAYETLENIDITEYFKGRLLTGCELFTTIDGATIELLGYNVDTKLLNIELPNIYKYSINDISAYEINKSLEIYRRIGIIINEENIDFNNIYASTEIHREITKHIENKKYFNNEEAWNSSYVFYREFMCNPNSKFFVDKSSLFPTLNEVIELIRKAKGLVFIPHIFVYGENSMNFLNKLTKEYHVDGVECYYSMFTNEHTQFLLKFCKENNLYTSGGSDYHGLTKPDLQLGIGKGNLNISKEIVDNWINKVI